MMLGQLNIHTQKNEVRPLPRTIYKNYSIQIKDLNIRLEIGKARLLGLEAREWNYRLVRSYYRSLRRFLSLKKSYKSIEVLEDSEDFYNNYYYLSCPRIQRLTNISNRPCSEAIETGRVCKCSPSLFHFICLESWWQ